MSEHFCAQEELLREMSGDIKMLLTEFKNMNGSLKDTKQRFDHHEVDSLAYRRKIDIVWAVIHAAKWVIIFFFGTGILWTWGSETLCKFLK